MNLVDKHHEQEFVEACKTAFVPDIYEFLGYLSDAEKAQYRYEMDPVERQKFAIIRKYNRLASDRLSHEYLVNFLAEKEKASEQRRAFLRSLTLQDLNVLYEKGPGMLPRPRKSAQERDKEWISKGKFKIYEEGE